ncbi:MAG: glutamate--tRNA ligase, partial [Oscillospiraceae bacterium]
GIAKAPAIFDTVKLNYINGEYIKALTPDEFHLKALPWIKTAVKNEAVNTHLISNLMQKRCLVLSDIPSQLDFIDTLPDYDIILHQNKKMKTNPETAKEALAMLLPMLEAQDDYSNDSLYAAVIDLAAKNSVKNGYLLWPFRVAVSGKETSPGGATELAEILGKAETVRRIKIGINKLGG